MTVENFLQRIRGPILVLVTVMLIAQGHLLLGAVVGWTAFEQIRTDTWLTGKLAALYASIRGETK